MNTVELQTVLANHRLYIDGEGGESADLVGANLMDANLRGAYLRGATGNMCELKSLLLDTYAITYSSETLQIGCENHSIDEWRDFDNKRINKMDGCKALKFWDKYKDFIFQAISLSPATPSTYKNEWELTK